MLPRLIYYPKNVPQQHVNLRYLVVLLIALCTAVATNPVPLRRTRD